MPAKCLFKTLFMTSISRFVYYAANLILAKVFHLFDRENYISCMHDLSRYGRKILTREL